ncbi:MAG: hypothetical protein H7X71_05195, partial [Chitinophagales bacterium]|nr:hypothetical protein [Chitinophagales bacterium]
GYLQVDSLLFFFINKNYQLKETPVTLVDYVVISGNPFLNMEALGKEFPHAVFLLDGSNSRKSIQYWKKYFNEHKMPYYDITEQGYLALSR